MTGTTRAALRLALGVLRGDILRWPRNDYAIESLSRAAAVAFDPIVIDAARAAHRAETWHEYRPIRARLALYLRAVLRAEAGDFGRWTETGCGSRLARGIGPPFPPYCYYGVNPGERAHAFVATRRQPPPLWSQAPTRAT